MQKNYKKECRFYRKDLPSERDLTMVVIKEVGEHSITVELLEYDRIEGMIAQAEYTRVRRSKFNKGILKAKKMRKQEVCYVIRVDEKKRFIDLSKKQINSEQAKICEENYEKNKKVQNLFFPLCDSLKMDMEQFYEMIVWKLEENDKAGRTPYDILQDAIFDFDSVIDPLALPDEVRAKFREELFKKFKPADVKIKATFEVSCFSRRGVEDLKEALRKGEEKGKESGVKVNLISSPLYVMQLTTNNRVKGISTLGECLEAIESEIGEKGGRFKVEEAPHVLGDKEKLWEQLIKDKKDLIAEDEDNDEGMGDMDIAEDYE